MTKAYVSISHHRIYFHPHDAPWEYAIETNDQILQVIQKLFDQKDRYEWSGFWRAQLPSIPYHLDPENRQSDIRLKKILAVIHEFGDDEAKKHIESIILK